jgi:phage baseplate assembly protein W
MNEGMAISLPFNFNSFGELNATADPRKIWQDRVIEVILTRYGEKVMRPNFGSGVSDALFENEADAIETATSEIGIAFNTWLKDLKLLSMEPTFDRTNGFLVITLVYRLPSGETDTVTLKTAILSRSGDLIQEIPNV